MPPVEITGALLALGGVLLTAAGALGGAWLSSRATAQSAEAHARAQAQSAAAQTEAVASAAQNDHVIIIGAGAGDQLLIALEWAAVLAVAFVVVTGAGISWVLLIAARRSIRTMLVISLTLLILILVAIYTGFGQLREEVIPLASAALGALVASLTQMYADARHDQNDRGDP